MYTTGRLARLAAVTVKALRHYEHVGLLAPKRTGARHRRYSPADAHRLEQILALKSLGLPLDTIKTMLGRGHVPLAAHRQRLEDRRATLEHAIEALTRIEQHPQPSAAIDSFIRDSVWDRWEVERRKRASPAPRAPDRASESKRVLFREIEAALDERADSPRAQELAARWRDTSEPERLQALKNRARWPEGMRRYIASLYETTPETFERVAAFIETSLDA